MNTTQVIVADAAALIAKGKTEVESAIAKIDSAEQEASAYISAERAKINAALTAYIQAHGAEVDTAKTLLSKIVPAIESTASKIVPAATLAISTQGNVLTKIKIFLGYIGWKGWLLILVCLGALHALHKGGII